MRQYIEGIPAEHRPIFERLQGLLLEVSPEASVAISYGVPTYRAGDRRIFLGAWRHGVSIYGWGRDRDGGFTSRHPQLQTGKGTIQLSPAAAEAIADEEFRALFTAALTA